MISSLVLVLAAVQTDAALLDRYRAAQRLHEQAAYAEAVRICEELAKARPDREGALRVRVGANLEDREFQPRRLAGDASMQMAKSATDIDDRLRLATAAVEWYRQAEGLKLESAAALRAAAEKEKKALEEERARTKGAEAMRAKAEAIKAGITRKIVERDFEAAYAELELAKAELTGPDAPAWNALKADLDGAFQRWHEGLLADLRQDLEAFRPRAVLADPAPFRARFARYDVPPARVAPARLDPALPWAARLAAAWTAPGGSLQAREDAAREGLAFGAAAWRFAEGLVLESAAAAVRDPGGDDLDARWTAVLSATSAFTEGARRAREAVAAALPSAAGVRKAELERWLAEDLTAFERRVEAIRTRLPDRDAPAAVARTLARLRDPAATAGGRREGYATLEAELQEILKRATLEPAVRAQALAGVTLSRAHALFLDGAAREKVLERCREEVREAVRLDAKAFERWTEELSPRIGWVISEALR